MDRIFDASPLTVFNELIQNARRAGATEVWVELEKIEGIVHTTLYDNGRGVTSPRPLLRLAGSQWDDDTKRTEDPAGMGFFCLSAFECVRVKSQAWKGVFTPAVFSGTADLSVSKSRPHTKGMHIQWYWRKGVTLEDLQHKLKRSAKYCGISAVHMHVKDEKADLDELITVKPEGYLDKATHVEDIPSLGISVGLTQAADSSSSIRVRINFNGVEIVESISRDDGYGLNACHQDILVDVKEVKGLQLVLPARNALKHTEAREKLFRICERKLFEWIAENKYEEHQLSYKAYVKARDEHGVDIGEAAQELYEWSFDGYFRSYSRADSRPMMLVGCGISGNRPMHALWHEEASSKYKMCSERPQYAGYKWYDKLPTLDSFAVEINGRDYGDDLLSLDVDERPRSEHPGMDFVNWVESIKVRFLITGAPSVVIEPDYVLLSEEEGAYLCSFDDSYTEMYVLRSLYRQVDQVGAMADFVQGCLFTASDDYEAEHYERQSDNFALETSTMLMSFIGGDEAAFRYMLEDYVSNLPWDLRNSNTAWSITYKGGESPRIAMMTYVDHSSHDNAKERNKETKKKLEEEASKRHKILTFLPRNEDASSVAVSSRDEITPERMEAYLREVHGYEPEEDSYTLDAHEETLDLDAWEKEQQSKTDNTNDV